MKASLSSISFTTDATRANAPEIPLALMLEVIWPGTGEARWLGMISRKDVTEAELTLVNLDTYPQLKSDPHKLVAELYETGRKAAWGKAARAIVQPHSALIVREEMLDLSESELLQAMQAYRWTDACAALTNKLSSLQSRLVPTIVAAGKPAPTAKIIMDVSSALFM